ncbi:hypothetical protein AMTRI_Chr02g254760 [Amborella trichopoda]
MILIIFNVLLSTKEPLKCPIMKFFERETEREEEGLETKGERRRGVRGREREYLMRRSRCGGGRGGGMEEAEALNAVA